jgi:hypothetical protein
MRWLAVVALIVTMAGLPAMAEAQVQPAEPAAAGSTDYGLHPALAIIAGGVTGVVVAAAIGGSLVIGQMLVEGVVLQEALEVGTGLSLSGIAASAVLGGLLGHLMFNR